jgi:hypothetical protein
MDSKTPRIAANEIASDGMLRSIANVFFILVRMSRRYGHIGQIAQRQAVNALNLAGIQDDGA